MTLRAVCFSSMRLDYNIPKQMQAEALEVIDKVEFFPNQTSVESGVFPWKYLEDHPVTCRWLINIPKTSKHLLRFGIFPPPNIP